MHRGLNDLLEQLAVLGWRAQRAGSADLSQADTEVFNRSLVVDPTLQPLDVCLKIRDPLSRVLKIIGLCHAVLLLLPVSLAAGSTTA
jgi:hypothetical protein